MMGVCEHLIPDDFLVNYKSKNNVEKLNYLINTLTLNIRGKMNNPDVKSQLDLLGIEQNKSLISHEKNFYKLHAVNEELKALQGTTNLENSKSFQEAIVSSLPSIIDFCTALIAARSENNAGLHSNQNLFEIKKTEISNEIDDWEKTLSDMCQHSEEQLKKNQFVIDYTDSSFKDNFMLSKAFSVPLENSFYFSLKQHSTTEMDTFFECKNLTTYHELYARRRLQHYDTNLQQITTFKCMTGDNLKVDKLIENYDTWKNKVDTVKHLFLNIFFKQEDVEDDRYKMLNGLFDISAEINLSPPLKKLYQEYISNPQNLPSNEGNLNLDNAIQNLHQHRENFLDYINTINKKFYTSVFSKLNELPTAENKRKFCTEVQMNTTVDEAYIHIQLNKCLTFFDLSGNHQEVPNGEKIKKIFSFFMRKLHFNNNFDSSDKGKAYNTLGNSLYQLFMKCNRGFQTLPVLYTMFAESMEDIVTSTTTNFDIAKDADTAAKYWRMHVQSFLSYVCGSKCSEAFLQLMSTINNEQQGTSNTAASGTNVEDPTVVTDEGNNLKSKYSTSSTSRKSNETHYTSSNCTSSSTTKPTGNRNRRNKSNNKQGDNEKENSEKFSTTTCKNSSSTSKSSAKKKTSKATESTKENQHKPSGTAQSAKYHTQSSSTQKKKSKSSGEKPEVVIDLCSSDSDDEEDSDEQMEESVFYSNHECFKILCVIYDFFTKKSIGDLSETYVTCNNKGVPPFDTIQYLKEVSQLLDEDVKFQNLLKSINENISNTITGGLVDYWMKGVLHDTIFILTDEKLKDEYNKFYNNKRPKQRYKSAKTNMANYWENLFFDFRDKINVDISTDIMKEKFCKCLTGLDMTVKPDKYFNEKKDSKIFWKVKSFKHVILKIGENCNIDSKNLEEFNDENSDKKKRKSYASQSQRFGSNVGNQKKNRTKYSVAKNKRNTNKASKKKNRYEDLNSGNSLSTNSSTSYISSSSDSDNQKKNRNASSTYSNLPRQTNTKFTEVFSSSYSSSSDDEVSSERCTDSTDKNTGNFSNNNNVGTEGESKFQNEKSSTPSADFSEEKESNTAGDDTEVIYQSIQHNNETGTKLLKCSTSSAIMHSVFELVKNFYMKLVQVVDAKNIDKVQCVNAYFRSQYKFDPTQRFEGRDYGKIIPRIRKEMFQKLFFYLLHNRNAGPLLTQGKSRSNFSRHISVGLHLHFAVSLYGILTAPDNKGGKIEAYIVGASPDYFAKLDNNNNNAEKTWPILYMGIIENTIELRDLKVKYVTMLWKEMLLKIKGKYINKCDSITLIEKKLDQDDYESAKLMNFNYSSGNVTDIGKYRDMEILSAGNESENGNNLMECTFEFGKMTCDVENPHVKVEVFDPEENFDLLLVNDNILQMKLPFTESWINVGQVSNATASESGFEWWKKAFGG